MTVRGFIKIHFFSKYKALFAQRDIDRYMRRAAVPRINIGCGKNRIPGWLNTDAYPNFGAVRMDASRPWPVAAGSFSACLCEHMIEHVPKEVGEGMMAHAFRALRPGGMLRVVTPDLAMFSRFVLESEFPERGEYLASLKRAWGKSMSACDAINQIFYSFDHRYIYSVEELSRVLQGAGFVDLRVGRGGTGLDPVFEGADGHMKKTDPRMNEIQAFAIEARKPS